ncbi:acyl-CoA thioesterase [Natrarchaeobius oligotrophus]|uniref:Acyl-CoA thioesterase n=1 Tax=Natrarchaeobius chitinivorans TaxID=1679083 RepID=A0A3N6MGK2_NATCH|nr:thioesterase family protein [Natrarchaeobius chitinivorans]RQH03119.1 acyl-CoA thioesterase [Natrarchaeobius chitinivorans]
MSEEFTVEVPVQFRDLDPLNHVNHATYASYLETARLEYTESVLEVPLDELSFVVANLEIDYRRPLTLDDEPAVALWVSELGESSCTMSYEIRADGDVAATAETTMVHLDREANRPTPIPEAVRERIREYEGLDSPE